MIKYIAFVGIAICLVACSPSQNETADTSVSSNPSNSNSGMKQEQLEYNSETANVENKTSDSIIKDKEYHLTPKKITIDAIDVKSEIESVGLLDNGEMAVPEDFTKTGWFDLGTKPGNRGSAVIAGHVDDKTGPGVFFDLKDLKIGDEVNITGEDGRTLTFEVVDRQVFPKDDAPIEDIFGYTSRRMLNLITCIGTFDHSIGGRTERLVVFTELKEE